MSEQPVEPYNRHYQGVDGDFLLEALRRAVGEHLETTAFSPSSDDITLYLWELGVALVPIERHISQLPITAWLGEQIQERQYDDDGYLHRYRTSSLEIGLTYLAEYRQWYEELPPPLYPDVERMDEFAAEASVNAYDDAMDARAEGQTLINKLERLIRLVIEQRTPNNAKQEQL